eukprot:TRINITY_DN152_c0_g1_i7.p1 TRINITY_DN152_c0_g1~~TRINITY_DN152_c0_g1_i7.p1  ORF type:complete len:501 (+),score=88.75 TRINITY_DN152_c0_g1_i7:712-2214(+)
MAESDSAEARLRSLEGVCAQLNQQMKAMKRLVDTRLNEMQQAMESQVEEIRQIMMQQDRIYQERMRRLDARVEQLSEFALQLARQKSVAKVAGNVALTEGLDVPPPAPNYRQPAMSPQRAVSPNSFVPAPSPEASQLTSRPASLTPRPQSARPVSPQQRRPNSPVAKPLSHPPPTGNAAPVEEVLAKYGQQIERVFGFYCNQGYTEKLRRTMDLTAFTKMVKDANLCNIHSGQASINPNYNLLSNPYGSLPPPELLWMMCVKRLHPEAYLAVEPKAKREIAEEQFGVVLQVLSDEHYGKRAPEMPYGERLERLIVNDIIPGAQARMQAAQETGLAPEPDAEASETLPDAYLGEAVQQRFRDHRKDLQAKYQLYVSRHALVPGGRRRTGMILAGLFDLAKEHNLLPFINKASMRGIFNTTVAKREHEESKAGKQRATKASSTPRPEVAREPEIDYDGFCDCLKLMAERIYGDKIYVATYASPESRIDKLFAKLFLLAGTKG